MSVGAPLVWMLRTQLVVAVAPGMAQRLTRATDRPRRFRGGRVDVAQPHDPVCQLLLDLIQRTHISTWRWRLSPCLVIIARLREEFAAFALLVGKHFGVEFGSEICTCFQCLAGALLGELSEEFAALRIACLDEFDRLALDVGEFFGPALL